MPDCMSSTRLKQVLIHRRINIKINILINCSRIQNIRRVHLQSYLDVEPNEDGRQAAVSSTSFPHQTSFCSASVAGGARGQGIEEAELQMLPLGIWGFRMWKKGLLRFPPHSCE